MRKAELIAVGRVLRPQGRHGEVRLEPLTDDPARLRELTDCYLVPPEDGERRAIEDVWFQGSVPILKLAGADNLSDAEALVGRMVSIPRAAVRPLPSDRFYLFDLVGAEVRTPDGTVVGTLSDVLAGNGSGEAHDVWIIRAGEREHLVPAVAAIVEAVRLEERVVIIRPPDGLLEL